MIRDKRILVAVLNWGLGHATRSVPIIRKLINDNNHVSIASDGDAMLLLKSEFPNLEFIELPSYSIQYPTANMYWNMLIQLPKIIRTAYRERKIIKHIMTNDQYQVIISDNRYGCYESKCQNIFITHQLNLKAGMFSGVVNRLQAQKLKNFQEIWVPDFVSRKLSGDLSDSRWVKNINLKYIGPQSRLKYLQMQSFSYEIAVLLSGPEPQRSILERILYHELCRLPYNSILIRGSRKPAINIESCEQINVVNYAGREDLSRILAQSQFIIARSGYSSLMDLNHIGGKALLIPTPGQTEQMYLAKNLTQLGIAESQNQENINIEKAWQQKNLYTGFPLA